MNMSFQQTLSEIKNNMSYDINRKSEKVYANLKSIKRLNSEDRDLHGNLWNERVILEVGTIDLDSKRCEVTNPITKMNWITDISKLTFCNADGSHISFCSWL